MYNQLLYTAGGGIISNNQKGKQASCATLAIGLGGTGINCLRGLKRMVYERLQADDPSDSVASYSHIKFLAVDSDRCSCESDGKINSLDEATEFFDISSADIRGMLREPRLMAGIPQCQWLKLSDRETGERGINIYSDRPEASGIRQIGRLLLMGKSDAFVNKVRQLVIEAKKVLPEDANVNVHIFSGLGGITGSGTFLDACYLVQKALDDIGEGRHAITCGYFFLPDVNLSLPHIGSRQEISHHIQANGYAAMKELDYCMGFGTNGGCWEQEYKGFKIGPVTTPPVKLCHLISANTLSGDQPKNGYENAMNVVGEYVMQFLMESNTNMTAHLANYHMASSAVGKDHGANYKYIALGASKAAVPIREISTYLGSKMFETFTGLKGNLPANEEIVQFAKENYLDFERLMQCVMDETSFDMTIPTPEENRFRGSLFEADLDHPNELILPDSIMIPFRNNRYSMEARVAANIESLTQNWSRDGIRENDTNTSLVWKVYRGLERMVADPYKGPYYASTVLYGPNRRNLVDILQGDLEITQRLLRNTKNDLSLRMEAVKKTRGAYLHPGFFQSRQRLFDAFIAATTSYFELSARILVLEKMQGMILKMMEQFKDLYRMYFEPFRRTYDELLETFHENYRAMSGGDAFSAADDPFTMNIPERNHNLIELLDNAVEKLDLVRNTQNFNGAFFNAYDVWAKNDGNKIAKFVSDYVVDVFCEFTQRPLTKYLKMQFDTTDNTELQNKTMNEILRPLSDRDLPLFWRNPQYFANQGSIEYMSIPKFENVVSDAAKMLTYQKPELGIAESAFSDRILFLRCLCGVPMYGYNGTSLYRETYRHGYAVSGTHIYEGTKGDPRDWRKLPDPIPFSVGDLTKEMLEIESKYFRAVECGIIHENKSGYGPYNLDEYEGIDDIESLAEEACEGHSFVIAEEVLRKIEDYLQNRQPVNVLQIPNDGSLGREEIVRKDYVLGSYVYLEAIERQLGILDRLEEIKKKMKLLMEE